MSLTMTTTRILLADDHEVVRQGLRVMLEAQSGWEVVGEAVNGREAVEKTRLLKPDIVVLDITMPELNGLEATRQILKVAPQTEVLVLTMHESEQVAREVLSAGARGYLLKSDAGRDLVTAVDALRNRRPFFTPRISQMVLDGYLHGPSVSDGGLPKRDLLTPREREIVQLLAEGKSNKEVASSLGISPKTIETHRANIMRKLNLHSVSDLVRFAVRNRMVEP
jgi:DNA-binding NarL/FixJ family response regulator